MATVEEVYKYIKDVRDFVPEEVLSAFGADASVLAELKEYSDIVVYPLCDTSIMHGIFCGSSTAGASYIAVNDADWLKPTTSFSCRIKLQLADYLSSTNRMLISKVNGYSLLLTSTNKYKLTINKASDSSGVDYVSTDDIDLDNNTAYWIRADWIDDDGASNTEVEFLVSSDDVADSEDVDNWTSIEVFSNTPHGIAHSTTQLTISNRQGSASENLGGILYAAEFYGQGQRQMKYNFEEAALLSTADTTIRDEYQNILNVVGPEHKLLANNISKIYYLYNGLAI